MRIHFTRHGESQANLLHEISNRGLRHGLTLKGREQAAALAPRLAVRPITHIYTSPILRAIETAVIVANRLGVEYTVTDALREYDCGVLEGRADEAAWEGWRNLFEAWVVHKRWEDRIEGGESFYDIQARFEPFIAGLLQTYAATDAEIVCVGHGGLYWMMLPVVLKNVTTQLIAQHKFDYAGCVVAEVRPEGLSCVEWNGQPISA